MRKREKRSNNKQTIVRDYANNTIYCYDSGVITIMKFSDYNSEPRTVINIYEPNSFITKMLELIKQVNGG